MKNTPLILLLIISLIACSKQTSLEIALNLSKKNRTELLNVLEHYSGNPQKLKAAQFLIENMPGHYSFTSKELSAYRTSVFKDSLVKTLPWSLKNIFLGYPYRLDDISLKSDTLYDIDHIRADFLINNIDNAFQVWKKPWAKHLTFDEFCEYILPYRVDNEPLEFWRDSLEGEFANRLEWILKIDEYYGSSFWACSYLNDEFIDIYRNACKNPFRFNHDLLRKALDINEFTCSDYVYGTLFAMRSVGIPVTMDFIPQWASRRNPHFWNTVLTNDKRNIPFVGFDQSPTSRHKPDVKMIKVYRKTYARNNNPLAEDKFDEPIPPFFTNRFYKDVTEEYLNTVDIEVDLIAKPEAYRKLAYLCVFDNEKWVPVEWGVIKGKEVKFHNVGTGVVCMAGYWIDGEIIEATYPFQIGNDGKINYLIPSEHKTVSLKLTRKYPLSHRIVDYGDSFLGVVIEASNDEKFSEVDTLHTINQNYWGNYATFIPQSEKKYRYVRIRRNNRRSLAVAELQIYGKNLPQPLKSEAIASWKENKKEIEAKKISDEDPATYMHIKDWAGVDLMEAVEIDSIRFLSYHDDNNVVPGQIYELYYWNGPDRVSLGKTVSEQYAITYDSVPQGALYMLRNLTKGKEERIFTYENKRVIFW